MMEYKCEFRKQRKECERIIWELEGLECEKRELIERHNIPTRLKKTVEEVEKELETLEKEHSELTRAGVQYSLLSEDSKIKKSVLTKLKEHIDVLHKLSDEVKLKKEECEQSDLLSHLSIERRFKEIERLLNFQLRQREKLIK